MVTVTVSEPDNRTVSSEVELIAHGSASLFKWDCCDGKMPVYLTQRIARLLQIPLQSPAATAYGYDLLIGADLMTSLLWPPNSTSSPKVISLLPNLTAHETRFGYYLQGRQGNTLNDVARDWYTNRPHQFGYWQCLFLCLAVDVLIALLALLNLYSPL